MPDSSFDATLHEDPRPPDDSGDSIPVLTPESQAGSSADAMPTFAVEATQRIRPQERSSVTLLHCPRCGTIFDVKNYTRGRDLPCPSCGTRLIPPPTAGVIDASRTVVTRAAQDANEPRGIPFGRYQLLSELGRGGMGVVLKAWDTQLKRVVALKKILSSGEESRVQVERFMREARVAAKLRHPHIVGVLDVSSVDGQHFFTSEFIDGTSVFHAAKETPPPPARQRVGWVKAVAEALHYAHGQGVVHRDVKPENILLDREGKPYVADFGLAREVQLSASNDGPSISVSGGLLGTPRYMSPEQADGRTDQVGPATDQYSLGVVLYELLTGKLPYQEESLGGLLNAIVEKDPVPLTKINPQVHRDVEAIVLKSLEKDPARRYPDLGEMAADLGRYLDGEPIRARPVSWLARVVRKARRNRTVTWLAASLAASALAVLVLLGWYAVLPRIRAARAARAADRARQERRDTARAGLERAREAVATGRLDEAAQASQRVADDCAPFAAKGEDLPVADAHVLLGVVARARGDGRLALVESYRAFEAAIGTPGEASALVLVARQLVEMNEAEQAERLFERALAAHPAPRDAFLARFGLARLLLRQCRFEEARRMLQPIADDERAVAAEKIEIAGLIAFLDQVSGVRRVRLSGFSPSRGVQFTDLDGSGTTFAYAITEDGKGLVLARLEGDEAKEVGRVRVLGDEPYGLSNVQALDLDGDGVQELVCAGGTSEPPAGTLAVASLHEGKLAVSARTSLQSGIMGAPFALVDLAGDGQRTLAVGTSMYERALRLYRYDEANRRLDPATKAPIPLGGDTYALVARGSQVWAFVGAWSTFGVEVFGLDPSTKELKVVARTPICETYSVDPASPPTEPLLIGGGWSDMALQSYPRAVGRKTFESTCRRPGLYELALGKDGAVDVKTVWQPSDPKLWCAQCDVSMIRGERASYAWTALPQEPAQAGGRPGAPVRLWRRDGDAWTWIASLDPPAELRCPCAYDFDHDGGAEIFVVESSSDAQKDLVVRILGQGRPEEAHGGEADSEAAAERARLPRRAEAPALVAAHETERVRLYEEAWNDYSRALRDVVTEDDLVEAGHGLVRCGLALGRCEETASAVYALLARYPTLARPVGGALLDALEEAGKWKTALACVRELRRAAGVTSEEQEALRAREGRIAALAEPRIAFDWRKESRTCDLLATTPFAATMDTDGATTFYGCSAGQRAMFVPLAYDSAGWRLDATVEVPRHEWAIDLEVGIAAGDPAASFVGAPDWTSGAAGAPRFPTWQGMWMAAEGETTHPSRFWELRYDTPQTHEEVRWKSGVPQPLPAQDVSIEFAPHQRRLRLGDLRVDDVTLPDGRVCLALGASGRTAQAAFWAEVRLSDMRLLAAGPGTKAVRYEVTRAVDAMLLANGRWIQGRREEARNLYDLAVTLGDEEAAREEALRKRGLPSHLDAPWGQLEKWVSIDARLWRGLLRGELEGAQAAAEDVAAAAQKDPQRFAQLLLWSARPLVRHPDAATALRALMMQGQTPGASAEEFGAQVLKQWGGDVAEALLAGTGVRPVRRAIVEKCTSRSGANPANPNDVILAVEGAEVHGVFAYQAAIADAGDAGKRSVTVTLRRGAQTLDIDLVLDDAQLQVADAYEFVKSTAR